MSRRKPLADKSSARAAVLRPLGEQVRRLRQDRQMTQEKLAELSGLNYKYIGRVELGKAEPGTVVLVRLARGLSVPVGDLFETITPPTNAPRLLPVREVEHVTAALQDLTSAVDRLFATHRVPAPKPSRRSGS